MKLNCTTILSAGALACLMATPLLGGDGQRNPSKTKGDSHQALTSTDPAGGNVGGLHTALPSQSVRRPGAVQPIGAGADCQYDDGSTENALNWTAGGVVGWAQRYEGCTSEIHDIATTYGLFGSNANMTAGQPVGYAIMTDSGAGPGTVIWQGEGAADPNAFNTDFFQILPVVPPQAVAGSYYIAVWVQVPPPPGWPAPMDETSAPGHAADVYFFGTSGGNYNDFNPNAPGAVHNMAAIGFPSVWMLRANMGEAGDPIGACCLGDGPDECLADVFEEDCDAAEGQFLGVGSNCANCPQPVECPAGEPCVGDLNNSGAVDVQDLLILLGSWGPCPGCPADLNNSGAVDVQDLLILLGNWGPCPGGDDPGVFIEDEPCGDDNNGGCNASPPSYEPIKCGQTVCGTAWADLVEQEPEPSGNCAGNCGGGFGDPGCYDNFTCQCYCDEDCHGFGDCCPGVCTDCPNLPECAGGLPPVPMRDTDWYTVTVDESTTLTWAVHAEFPAAAFIINDQCGDPGLVVMAAGNSPAGVPFEISACVPAGTYRLFVATSVFQGYPCGSDNDYIATLSCEPCIITGACCYNAGANCDDFTVEQCDAVGGDFQGANTSCANIECPQPGDSCSNAEEVIPGGGAVVIDNTGYPDTAATCGGFGPNAGTVWFKVVGNGQTLFAETCGSAPDGTVMTVYCGGCGNPVCIGGSDEDSSFMCGNPFHASFSWCSETGVEYFVAVRHTAGTNPGNISLQVTSQGNCGNPPNCPEALNNIFCADALDITANINQGPFLFDSSFGLPGPGHPDVPAGSPTCHWSGQPGQIHHVLWYSFEAPGPGVTIETCAPPPGPYVDSVLAVYEGTCGNLTQIGCGEDDCGPDGFLSRAVVTGLTPGNTYIIMVANSGGWDGWVPGEYFLEISSDVPTCNPSANNPQTPDSGAWTAGVSDVDFGAGGGISLVRYECIPAMTVNAVRVWGLEAGLAGGFPLCQQTPANRVFNVKFYADNAGQPGAEICSHVITATNVVQAPGTYAGRPLWQYNLVLPQACTGAAWISVQGASAGDNCGFLWMSSGETGDGFSYLEDETNAPGVFNLNDFDLSLLLNP